MQKLETNWIRLGMWLTQPRLRREEGMTTAELLANVALGVVLASVIFAGFTDIGEKVIEKIRNTVVNN